MRFPAKGVQSIPRSRSQARRAAGGRGQPGRFSYDTTATHATLAPFSTFSALFALMAPSVASPRGQGVTAVHEGPDDLDAPDPGRIHAVRVVAQHHQVGAHARREGSRRLLPAAGMGAA